MLLVLSGVIIGIVIVVVPGGQILGRGLEIVLVLGIHVLVIVLLLLVLFLLVLQLLLLLLLVLLTLVLVLLLLLLLLSLLSLIIRHIGTSAVISIGIIVQLIARSTRMVSTVISVRATIVQSIATAAIMRGGSSGIVRSFEMVGRSFVVMTALVVMRGTLVMSMVTMVGVVDLWWGTHVRVLVVVLVNKRLLDAVLLLVEQVSNLVDQMLVGGDVQVDQRFEHLLAVIVLGDLEGDQGIDVDHAQVQAVGRDRTEIGILSRIGAIGIEGISVAGVGQAKGDAERRLYLLIAEYPADAIRAIEVQKTLKQYCKLFFRFRQNCQRVFFCCGCLIFFISFLFLFVLRPCTFVNFKFRVL